MGDLYFSDSATSISLDLPRRTKAFYFYAMTDKFGTWAITAKSGHRSSGPVTITNNGSNNAAKYFGFYGKKPGVHITSITVTASPDSPGIAVGEFGIAR